MRDTPLDERLREKARLDRLRAHPLRRPELPPEIAADVPRAPVLLRRSERQQPSASAPAAPTPVVPADRERIRVELPLQPVWDSVPWTQPQHSSPLPWVAACLAAAALAGSAGFVLTGDGPALLCGAPFLAASVVAWRIGR